MGVADIIKQLVQVQKTIPGIATCYDNPPEGLDKTPAFVTYPDNVNIDWPRQGSVRGKTYDIVMDLYLSRAGSLPDATAATMPFLDLVPDTFDQHVQLGGTTLVAGVSDGKIAKMSYAGVDYLGIRFTLKAMTKTQVVYKG